MPGGRVRIAPVLPERVQSSADRPNLRRCDTYFRALLTAFGSGFAGSTAVRRLPAPRISSETPRRPAEPDEPTATHAEATRGTAGMETLEETVVAPPDAQLRPDGAAPSPRPARVEPLAPFLYKVQFSASAALRAKLERLQALLPGRDLAQIIELAVTNKIERIEARRFAQTCAPRTTARDADGRPSSRHISAAIRRAVYERDRSRCRFVDKLGNRCKERHRLEFHHRHPFALGGGHETENIRLMCQAHNRYLAQMDFGRRAETRHAAATT